MTGEHAERVEADLARYYGVDLRDLWRPGSGLTLRRVGALVAGLPVESRTMSALAAEVDDVDLAEPEYPTLFSLDQHLLASIVDGVNSLHYAYAQVHAKGSVTRPERVPRPGRIASRRRRLSETNRQRIERRNRMGVK